jgi:membrane protease YdiL (CAAX protease family)
MDMKRKTVATCIIIILCCGLMAVVDGIIQPHYAVKSGIKLALFLAVPFIWSIFDKDLQLKKLFIADRKSLKMALMLCIPVYIVILGGYMLLKDVFDFSAVTASLTGNIGVTKENFIFVSVYISFVNSLLEEFFFRGFSFLTLRRIAGKKFAMIFSAAAFALYHVAMMTGWFGPVVFVLIMAGLFAGGIIFNYLNSKSGNIYASWFVHMFANFAINTVGFILFGII